MLNDLSLTQEGGRLCREEWIFQQGINNAPITKKYLPEPKKKKDFLTTQPALQTKSYRKFVTFGSSKSLRRRSIVFSHF